MLPTNSPELVHTFAMGVLNPTRDMLCFVKVVAFLSLVYRLHVNYVGTIHIIFSLLLAWIVGIKLNNSSTHAERASMCRHTPSHTKEDRATGFL